jgi:hypothetical protein
MQFIKWKAKAFPAMNNFIIFLIGFLNFCNGQAVSASIPASLIQAEASARAQEIPSSCARAVRYILDERYHTLTIS